MAARIVELKRKAADADSGREPNGLRPAAPPGQTAIVHRLPLPIRPPLSADDPVVPFRFWRGASREAYVHSVFRLVDCPPIGPCTYLLARTMQSGRRMILAIGRLEATCPGVNLATLRHQAASAGADEVHVHTIPTSAKARRLVELDLRSRLLGSLSGPARPRLA